ncbi:hypothetical protein SpCBS45565_g05307 [Spizellomyces sp. 'palustris']|nr:hypothetical protein SpCBS45565_g05307 [Spizellomyces sp. 'palustris']
MPSSLVRWDLFYSPEWCDWRFRIYDCENSSIWVGFYITYVVLSFVSFLVGLYVCYMKVYQNLWKKKLSVIEFNEGILRPKATEAWVIGSTIFLFGRGLYGIVVLSGGFKNSIVTELFHEWPWCAIYIGGVLLTMGLIHATPRNITDSKGASASITQIVEISLPSPRTINALTYIYIISPLVLHHLFAILDGYARDAGNFEQAQVYNMIHYLAWAVHDVALCALAAIYGLQLVRILRAAQEMKLTEGRNEAFKRAITTLIITLSVIVFLTSGFAAVLFFYGIFRERIQTILGVSILIAFFWLLSAPLSLAPLYLYMTYSINKSSESTSQTAGTGMTGRSGTAHSTSGSKSQAGVKSLP